MTTRRRLLNYQADQIEAVLASHRVHGRITGGTLTPRLVRFNFVPAWGTRIHQIIQLSEELALTLGARSCRVARHGGQIDLEFPRDDGGPVRLLNLCRCVSAVPPCTALLGVDGDGIPILLRLTSPDVAHVLIAGTTGSGKTALGRTMIGSLALHNGLGELGLVLIDPKGRGYGVFADLPHLVQPVARDVTAANQALEWAVAELERRAGADDGRRARLVVFIDELADLLMVGGKTTERWVTRLVQRGREAGIHVVASTQKPTAEVLGSLVKANFPVRVVGKVGSAEDARVAAGVAGTGAERLGGRGEFILVAQGQAVRLQAAFLPEPDIAQVLRQVGARPTTMLLSGGTESPPGVAPDPHQRAAGLRLVK
jgi:S-DNA-T family DNA segregation ATPase FtsK/SpoIIIE